MPKRRMIMPHTRKSFAWMRQPWTCPNCREVLPQAGGKGTHLVFCKKWKDNFWAKVNKRGHGGCWLWIAAIDSRGRGAFVRRQRRVQAHRISWELHHGPIPKGLWVLHHCDVRNCVNPKHLYLGDAQDNSDDRLRRGRVRTHATPVDQLLFPHLSVRFKRANHTRENR